ncbi:MAG: tRNA (adenosine(37)-N6)-threonylcarbamoyltransferase complex ATPase subunit type 1 TsaE [Candidatus Thermoplasmatota archaeon]|nr:tRNA (adenosine(37)-N6)-threonylcarbamoyltransferase complex ATPase subunit type 1 TsaE [Candidatus Thermoplasmatota archaeon]
MIDLIIDAGTLQRKPTSTVIRLLKDNIECFRKGTLEPKYLQTKDTATPEETKKCAQHIYQKYFKDILSEKAVVVILKGDLGSGKTVFAQGIGETFGKNLVSPTFVLMDEYTIDQTSLKNLYHLDLYRIEQEEELIALDIPALLRKGNLLLIEWGEKLSIFEHLSKQNACFYLIHIIEEDEYTRSIKVYQI